MRDPRPRDMGIYTCEVYALSPHSNNIHTSTGMLELRGNFCLRTCFIVFLNAI